MFSLFFPKPEPEFIPIDRRLDHAETHLFRVENMLHAMRLAILGIDNEDDGSALTTMVDAMEKDCKQIRDELCTKEAA